MAIETTFICDGCGRRETKRDAELPSYWAEPTISVSDLTNWLSGGSKSIWAYPTLCPDCQILLAERADPRKWTRAEPAK